MNSREIGVGFTTSAAAAGLASALASPSPDSTRSNPAITCRRLSPSTSSASSPISASASARFIAVVVVPSPPNGPVTSTWRASGPIALSSRVRMPRTASSNAVSVPNRGVPPRRPGSSAKVGRPESSSSFARVRTVRSPASRVNATAMASSRPAMNPITMFLSGTGETGTFGTRGGSTMVARASGHGLPVGPPPPITDCP